MPTIRDKSVVTSSVMPSAKYCCFDSGPPLVCDEPAATYERASDEHGRLAVAAATNRLGLGDKIRLVPRPLRPDRQPLRLVRLHPRQPRRAALANHRTLLVEAESRDPIRLHESILRAENQPLQVGLCNDQAIKGIVVMRRQAAGMLGMGTRHRQNLEAERQHRSDDRSIEAKLPDRSLDSDFPYGCRADDDLVRLVAHRRA